MRLVAFVALCLVATVSAKDASSKISTLKTGFIDPEDFGSAAEASLKLQETNYVANVRRQEYWMGGNKGEKLDTAAKAEAADFAKKKLNEQKQRDSAEEAEAMVDQARSASEKQNALNLLKSKSSASSAAPTIAVACVAALALLM